MSIFLIEFVNMLIIETYFSNMNGLLEDPKYYDFSIKDATALNSQANKLSSIPSIFMTFVTGLMFELYGRQKTLIGAFLLTGLSLLCFPLVAPNHQYITAVMIVYQLVCLPISSHPLI